MTRHYWEIQSPAQVQWQTKSHNGVGGSHKTDNFGETESIFFKDVTLAKSTVLQCKVTNLSTCAAKVRLGGLKEKEENTKLDGSLRTYER